MATSKQRVGSAVPGLALIGLFGAGIAALVMAPRADVGTGLCCLAAVGSFASIAWIAFK